MTTLLTAGHLAQPLGLEPAPGGVTWREPATGCLGEHDGDASGAGIERPAAGRRGIESDEMPENRDRRELRSFAQCTVQQRLPSHHW